MRNVLTKKLLLIALSVMFALCAFAGISTVKADDSVITAKSIEEITFTMTEGATPRVIEDYEDNGMTFKAVLSTADYEGLMANGYTSVTFGIVIAPAEWTEINELNEENLFGTDAKYCFSTAEAGKARIINLTTDELESDGINYFISGSIVNYKAFNIARELVGKAYIKVVATDDTITYKFADYFEAEKENNVRSMAEVAIKSVNDISLESLPNDKKEILRTQFVNKTAKVDHYLQQVEGEYVLEKVTYVSGDAGQTICAEELDFYGYSVNNQIDGAVLSTVLRENGGNETLKVYYSLKSYDVTYMAEDMTSVLYVDEGILHGEPSEYGSTLIGKVPKKRIGRNVYSFTGWVNQEGSSVDLNHVVSNYVLYPKFSTLPTKELEADCEKYVYADKTPTNNYRHAAVYFEVPEDAKITDRFNVKFKAKVDGNHDHLIFMMMRDNQNVNSGECTETGRGYFVNNAGYDWSSFELTNVCISTPDDFLTRFGGFNYWDNAQVPYDIMENEYAGLFLFIHGLPHQSIIQFKDIEITYVNNESSSDADYSFTSNNKDGYSAVCIGLPEGAQRGDAYSVSFKLKVNGPITTNAYGGAFIRAFSAFNAFTGNDQTYTAAPDGWVEVTMPNVVCVTAHDVYDWIVLGFKRQLNAPTLDINDNTTVGIYLLGFNVDNGTTIEVKDVVITSAN